MASHWQTGPDTLIPGADDDEEEPPFWFTASWSVEGSASALGGVVRTPGGEELPLEVIPWSGTLDARVGSDDLAGLQRRFSPGRYTVQLFGAQGLPDTVQVPLEASGFQVARVQNHGAAQDVDASRDFQLVWAPLGGSVGDPVTVMIGTMGGGTLLRSPDPGCPGALNGAATSFTIPAGTLRDGVLHRVVVMSIQAMRGDEIGPATESVSGYIALTEFSLMC